MAAEFVKRYLNIEDKVFLVSGGAVGVGAGIVRSLLEENARHVAFLDILDHEGSALEYELTFKFGALRAKFIKCDVSDENQLSDAYNQVLDKYRRLDGVINNAAVLSDDERLYKKMVDINFTAVVNSTTKAVQVMSKDHGGGGGIVLNISSLLALHIGPHLPVYAATKTAVLQYSIAIGDKEKHSDKGVRVVTACLGPTDTAILNRRKLENFNQIPEEHIMSRAAVRQRVESAVTGIMDVIEKAKGGSTWIVKNDQPAYEYTEQIAVAFNILSES